MARDAPRRYGRGWRGGKMKHVWSPSRCQQHHHRSSHWCCPLPAPAPSTSTTHLRTSHPPHSICFRLFYDRNAPAYLSTSSIDSDLGYFIFNATNFRLRSVKMFPVNTEYRLGCRYYSAKLNTATKIMHISTLYLHIFYWMKAHILHYLFI